ncbi:RNA polymerase sigma-70 factor (ECF subfamily) [Chitinophaga polysaccharea]|uniref:RNA polymerase sigma-70 factor (ECF subfamily) n=1 Tax=Chitinophaga polysaccharea TaxID=1293035 RepID=A0A561PPC6_9BACT|nr:sigma-70 family RNA polymerase sigma factor [Chitinophaga polysaccharea]TWF39960.1 RNA polymerase sigma-70 factor (ECF subfamily) [Chitinophaga polysaccharea]
MNTIAALKQGNLLVFNEVYYSWHKRIYYFILQKTKSSFIAEEVTQLTFIKCWNYRENLADDLNIQLQLFRIARTTLIDFLRKETVYKEKVIHVIDKYTLPVDDDLWGKLAEKELQVKLANALKEMPPMRRKVFEMSRFKGMSYQQIAHELSLSSRTVETHIFQAIKQIKHYLGFLISILAWLSRF